MRPLTDELEEPRRAIVAGDVSAVGLLSRNYVYYSSAPIESVFCSADEQLSRPVYALDKYGR